MPESIWPLKYSECPLGQKIIKKKTFRNSQRKTKSNGQTTTKAATIIIHQVNEEATGGM